MQPKMPNTPFSTRFSGSAKEIELRLRNIFQWKKKRPPVIILLAAALVALLCGSLVGFTTVTLEETKSVSPEIVMDVQYYDTIGNYIEIPMLVMPDGEETNEAVTAINLVLADIKEQYQEIPVEIASNQQCFFYPTETERYINLLLFRTRFFTDLNTGHAVSFVYDKEENRQVTMEDALILAGFTEQELFDALSAQYDPGYAQNYPDANICVQNHVLEAFRLDSNGQPIFYLTARTDDADDTVQDFVSGADYLYIWASGVFTIYEQYNIGEEYGADRIQPLVPTEETVPMETPLWNQWYFAGGEPEDGFLTIDLSQLDEKAYMAVLLGNRGFVDPLSGESFYIDRVREAVTTDTSLMIEPDYFTVVDLDEDGMHEVIVSLNVNGNGTAEYLVLRWQDGIVYGYIFAVRQFSDVRTDGTFWNTGGASDVGICKITFDQDTYEIERFTYHLYRPSDDSMAYFVDYQETTQEEWERAFSQWNAIPYVEWYEFTYANIEAALS